jgi:uncharacterized repeat protein (TIGR03803 family)
LILSGNTLYGTTSWGGTTSDGTVFKVNTDGTDFTTLHTFTGGSDGGWPFSALISSGNAFYGTATGGGDWGNGTLFKINPDGTGFTTLYSFSSNSVNPLGAYTNADGIEPTADLVLSTNTLYGTTRSGGAFGNGTVFSISFSPQLTITISGTSVILTWPLNYAGFDYGGYILQSTTNLGPSAVWTTNLPSPVVINGLNTVTNPVSGTQQFFRLAQ